MLRLEIHLTLPKRSSNISDTRVYHLPHNDQNFIEILLKPVVDFPPNNFKMIAFDIATLCKSTITRSR